jgi:hypothetical protein
MIRHIGQFLETGTRRGRHDDDCLHFSLEPPPLSDSSKGYDDSDLKDGSTSSHTKMDTFDQDLSSETSPRISPVRCQLMTSRIHLGHHRGRFR